MEFDEIFKTYWQKIFRLCMGYVNDADLAKDMTQETFINVWQQLPKFRNESAIGTWIFRIATNTCLRTIEKQNRFPRSEFPAYLGDYSPSSIEPQIEYLYKCVAELPETDRIIISLELEDVSQSDIAKIVGLSETNIRVRIHRIKDKLTEKFKLYER